jgi:alpha-mannosidase
MLAKIRFPLAGLLLMGGISCLMGQTRWPDVWTNGYGKTLRGETIDYHSPHPDVRSALLVRSIDSTRAIAWETGIGSRDGKNDTAFVWIYAMDCNDDVHAFDMWINGRKSIRFENPREGEKTPRIFLGLDGSELTFHPLFLDRAMDAMGYAVLRIPRSRILPRQAQTLSVSGESSGKRVWYMTFQSDLEETVVVRPRSRVLNAPAGPMHSVDCEIVRVGDPVKGAITIDGGKAVSFELQTGFNTVPLPVREVDKNRTFTAWVQIGSRSPVRRSFIVSPVRPWIVHFVQHTHTDIGYTRPQTEILSEHLRYIDTALDYCDRTDSLPDDARFRWTCETSWAVREYLNTRPPSQIERLKKRIQEGRIEVAGMMFNLSDLSDENTLAAQLLPIRQFHREGIPVRTAMQSDVNGAGWSLVDGLKSAGVEFFNMAQNTHRALKPIDRPTLVGWESPSGNRILTFRADHYMTGNGIGLLDPDSTALEKGLIAYLEELEKNGYPFHEIAVQYSGYFTDNSPPSTTACGRVLQWNRETVWPKIRLATVHEFPERIRDNRSIPLPVFRAAWPDWWTDGFGSAALETAYARTVHTDLIAHQGLFAMARLLGVGIGPGTLGRLESVVDDLNFYDEHTFGAAESVSDPTARNSVVQWGEKAATVWSAVKKNRLLREEAMGLLQSFVPRSDKPLLAVYNTLNWPRSGLVEVFIDHQILPRDRDFRILDPSGRSVPAQAVKTREEGTTWALWVSDLPPLGLTTLRIDVGSRKAEDSSELPFRGTLENDFYAISLDSIRGTIRSLKDKTLNRDLVDPEAPWGFGQWIYERLGSDRSQLESKTLHTVIRSALSNITVERIIEGPIWSSLSFSGQSPECADNRGVKSEIRLFHTDRRIEFRFSMRKNAVVDPEGVYVAFPFSMAAGTTIFEAQGGVVAPGKNQLEGSSTDWNGIQNFASVRNDREQIVFVSPEIPLVQFGDINLGRFQRLPSPSKPHFYSWVLNNYWTTNFRASQQGELNWSYVLTSSADPSIAFATRFGWGTRIPILARPFPAGSPGPAAVQSRSLLDLPAESLLLVSARPSLDGKGVILYMREIGGRPFDWDLSGIVSGNDRRLVSEVTVLEEPIRSIPDRLSFRPYEAKWLKVE